MGTIDRRRARDEHEDSDFDDRLDALEEKVRDHERLLRGRDGENGLMSRVKVAERAIAWLGGLIAGAVAVSVALAFLVDLWGKIVAMFGARHG